MNHETLAESFLKDLSSRYDLRLGKPFDREKANCAWFSKEFFEWCVKRGIPCQLAYFDHDSEAHISPFIEGKTIDFTAKQFTGNPEDDYMILDPSEYSRWGYGRFEAMRAMPDWATIRPADLIYTKKESLKMSKIKSWKMFLEGKTMKASKEKDSDVKIDAFRDKIESHLKSLDCDFKTVGSDFKAEKEDKSVEVMFRKDYVGVKAKGEKHAAEFKYDQLGKIKAEISKSLK